MRHRRQGSSVPSLATMPPAHDYPQAKTNCRDPKTVGDNKSDEYHEYVPPRTPRTDQESWTDVALMVLLGLLIAAFSMVLSLVHFAYFAYMMQQREGVNWWR